MAIRGPIEQRQWLAYHLVGDRDSGHLRGPHRTPGLRSLGGASNPASEPGFSLIELVMVLSIMGIVAALALPRFFEASTFHEHGFADELVAASRYAQKLAIATGCDVLVQVNGAGFALRQRASCTTGGFSAAVAHPMRPGSFTAAPPSGISLSAAQWYFDKIGRPRATSGSLLDIATEMEVGGVTITLEPQTGFVHRT